MWRQQRPRASEGKTNLAVSKRIFITITTMDEKFAKIQGS